MAQEDVQYILQKLVKDPTFRQKFKDDPGSAMDRFDLSQDERNALQNMDVDGFTRAASDLGRFAPTAAVGSLYI
jgi:hypothetical protein